ncbi:MAG: hypothetical protein EOO60_06055 [Hymenobacter sp.]|nr:MAG: hypothetical protein EOO60_06055 [Hymenobacter sp.]
MAAVPVAPAELLPVASPIYSTSPEGIAVEPIPPSLAATMPATPNPAAAFSLLGEAGKTIRRIVIFYNDGSFSNYQPEEQ